MTEPSQYFKGRTVQEQMNEVIGYVDTRAAEVATTAIASDVAQVHQDMLDADADAQAAAASAAAAAGTLANAVKKTGESSQSIAGDIAVAGDLSAGGDLAVTGDAGVQGQLSVLGGCDLRAPVNVPTVATGTFDDKVVNGTKLKNELDNYNLVLRTTGNQIITGIKQVSTGGAINFVTTQLQNRLSVTCNDLEQGILNSVYVNLLSLRDVNGNEVCTLRYQQNSTAMSLVCIFNDGTQHLINIATYSP